MSQENPWKKLSSRKVYENPWIRLREDQVIRPDGKPGIYSVVDTRIATGVVALNEKNEIYLIGQFRYAVDEYTWELVEGGSDKAEDPMITAQRELHEEAGLKATDWVQLGGQIQLSNCFTSEIAYVYLARGLSEIGAEPEGTEVLSIKKIPFEEAVSMVDRGQIKDGLSIIGILRAERYLKALLKE